VKPYALLCLLALTPACHRRGARAPAAPRWIVRPVDGPALRVEGAVSLRGAVRYDGAAPASPAHPASALVASARLADGWLFASEDGTLYRAASATGALSVVGALPTRAEPVRALEGAVTQGVHSRGRMAVIDERLGAYAVDPDGSHRPLAIGRALSACFVAPDELLAVSEPGVLRASHDGGRTFTVLRPPSGVALAVWNADDRTLVRTTAGTFRYARRALAPHDRDVSPASWLRAAAEVDGRFRDAFQSTPFALDPMRSAQIAPGRIATAQGDALVIVDARTGRELARDTLPGEGCELYPGFRGVRAVCRHQAWAKLVASRDADRAGWTVLRDEARAEPVGPLVFDDASRAWAVHAPCAQQTVIDPRDVCLVDAQGATHATRLPFDADLAAVHDGVALAVEAGVSDRAPRLVLVRADGVTTVALPIDARAPVTVRWGAEGFSALHELAAGGLARSYVRAPLAAPTWERATLPDGYTRGVFRGDGTLFAWGADARSLGWLRHRSLTVSTLAAVHGAQELVALDADAPSFCVGPWCRLGGAITATDERRAYAPALARAAAVASALPALRPLRDVVCEHGATRPAPEIDHGVAVSGHAMRASLLGATLTVTWSGATLNGAVSRAVAVRPGVRVFARGVQGAERPAGLVELCAPTGCAHLFATSAGFTDLGLGRAIAGGVEVQRSALGGYVARADAVRDGVPVVTLVAVSAGGAVTGRRTYALAGRSDEAHTGTWDGADGLWIGDRAGALRFVSIDARDVDGAATRVPAPGARTGGCETPAAPSRGTVRMLQRVSQVRGPGWFVEAGEWQTEEVLEVGDAGACVRSITSGEARDEDEMRADGREEHEPVRSFALRATAAASYEGTAWSGERAIALRCTVE
jgi:hypothetical protein